MINKILEQVPSIKYLGMIIDSKLNFRDHIKHISSRCNKLIHTLSKSAKQNWGLSRAALHTMYKEQFYHSYYTERQYGSRH
jgi:hypothetical protein